MNEKNYDYLKNQVKFMGFGEELDKQIAEKMQTQEEKFSIQHQTKFGKDEINSTLNFEKSKQSEMYFFQNFDMELKGPKFEEPIKQTYFVGKENNLTLKERYNMLDGRAVHKEFNRLEQTGEGENIRFKPTKETYKAWTDVNFKETDGQGNFEQRKMFNYDVKKTLEKFPVKEMADDYETRRLVASLEKGNLQAAKIVVDGVEQKVMVSANPRENTINFYDENMKRMEVRQVVPVKQELGEKQGEVNQENQAQKNVVNSQNTPGNEDKNENPAISNENGGTRKDQSVPENQPAGATQGGPNPAASKNQKEDQKQSNAEKQDDNKNSNKKSRGVRVG